MKRNLLDTKVVLDVLLDRRPFVDASAAVWNAVETRLSAGWLAAHAVTTVHYLLRKDKGNAKARLIVSSILTVFGVAKVDSSVIQKALQLGCSDFEDAVTAASACAARCRKEMTVLFARYNSLTLRLLPLMNFDALIGDLCRMGKSTDPNSAKRAVSEIA